MKKVLTIFGVLFLLLLIPIVILMFSPEDCGTDEECAIRQIEEKNKS